MADLAVTEARVAEVASLVRARLLAFTRENPTVARSSLSGATNLSAMLSRHWRDALSLVPTTTRVSSTGYVPTSASLIGLPLEIKIMIFRCLQSCYISEPAQALEDTGRDGLLSRPTPMVVFDRAWTRLAYVCKSMYAAAIGTPGLWTTIDCNGKPEYVILCIKRARPLPLLIVQNGYPPEICSAHPEGESRRRAVAGCFKLAREVHCAGSGLESGMNLDLRYMASHMAKRLKKLNLTDVHCMTLSQISVPGTSVNLRSLTLVGGTLQWNDSTPSLLALKELHIERTQMHDHRTVLRILSACPVIETLYVGNVVFDQQVARDKQAILPLLQTLTVVDKAAPMALWLFLIPVPRRHLTLDVQHSTCTTTFPSAIEDVKFHDVISVWVILRFWMTRTNKPMGGTLVLTHGDHQPQSDSEEKVPIITVKCAIDSGPSLVFNNHCDVRKRKMTKILLRHLSNVVIRGDVRDVEYLRLVPSSNIRSVQLEGCNTDNLGEEMKEWLRTNEGSIGAESGQL